MPRWLRRCLCSRTLLKRVATTTFLTRFPASEVQIATHRTANTPNRNTAGSDPQTPVLDSTPRMNDFTRTPDSYRTSDSSNVPAFYPLPEPRVSRNSTTRDNGGTPSVTPLSAHNNAHRESPTPPSTPPPPTAISGSSVPRVPATPIEVQKALKRKVPDVSPADILEWRRLCEATRWPKSKPPLPEGYLKERLQGRDHVSMALSPPRSPSY